MKKYYKYYVCGEHIVRVLKKESAIKKFEKQGLDVNNIKQTIDYKKAIRLANASGGVVYNMGAYLN